MTERHLLPGLLLAATLTAAPTPQWYGWQTLATDGLAITAGVIAFSYSRTGGRGSAVLASGTAAGVIYVLGGPVVHLLQEHPEAAAISLLSRILVPVTFGLLSLPLYAGAWGSCGATCANAMVGVLLTGLALPMVLDATVSAYRPRSSFAIAPIVDDGRRGVGLAIAF